MGSPTIFQGTRVKVLNSGGFTFQDGHVDWFGSGSPEGVVTAPPGSTYKDTNDPSTYYLKETGTGNTGWVALAKATNIPVAVEDVLPVTINGQTVFTLSNTPISSAAFQLFLNGQLRRNGIDYTQVGTTLTWLDPAGLTLLTTDELIANYNNVSTGLLKQVWFEGANYDVNIGNYRAQAIGATGAQRFTFHIPDDFNTLIKLAFIVIPAIGAAGAGRDIDLFSDYAAIGEIYNNHTESDTTSTYDFTGTANQITEFNVTHLFNNLSPDDTAGIFVDHNGIGGTINYLGIHMIYV